MSASSGDDVTVEIGGGLTCPRCSGPAYLSARIPHRMTLSGGMEARDYRTIMLCPNCDRDNPDAAGLLAFFAVHERIDPGTVSQSAALIDEWVRRSSAAAYTEADLDEDIRRWEGDDM